MLVEAINRITAGYWAEIGNKEGVRHYNNNNNNNNNNLNNNNIPRSTAHNRNDREKCSIYNNNNIILNTLPIGLSALQSDLEKQIINCNINNNNNNGEYNNSNYNGDDASSSMRGSSSNNINLNNNNINLNNNNNIKSANDGYIGGSIFKLGSLRRRETNTVSVNDNNIPDNNNINNNNNNNNNNMPPPASSIKRGLFSKALSSTSLSSNNNNTTDNNINNINNNINYNNNSPISTPTVTLGTLFAKTINLLQFHIFIVYNCDSTEYQWYWCRLPRLIEELIINAVCHDIIMIDTCDGRGRDDLSLFGRNINDENININTSINNNSSNNNVRKNDENMSFLGILRATNGDDYGSMLCWCFILDVLTFSFQDLSALCKKEIEKLTSTRHDDNTNNNNNTNNTSVFPSSISLLHIVFDALTRRGLQHIVDTIWAMDLGKPSISKTLDMAADWGVDRGNNPCDNIHNNGNEGVLVGAAGREIQGTGIVIPTSGCSTSSVKSTSMKRGTRGFLLFPVTDNIAKRYSKVIKTPVSISDLHQSIRGGGVGISGNKHDESTVTIHTFSDLLEDITLMARNSAEYNGARSEIALLSRELMMAVRGLKRPFCAYIFRLKAVAEMGISPYILHKEANHQYIDQKSGISNRFLSCVVLRYLIDAAFAFSCYTSSSLYYTYTSDQMKTEAYSEGDTVLSDSTSVAAPTNRRLGRGDMAMLSNIGVSSLEGILCPLLWCPEGGTGGELELHPKTGEPTTSEAASRSLVTTDSSRSGGITHIDIYPSYGLPKGFTMDDLCLRYNTLFSGFIGNNNDSNPDNKSISSLSFPFLRYASLLEIFSPFTVNFLNRKRGDVSIVYPQVTGVKSANVRHEATGTASDSSCLQGKANSRRNKEIAQEIEDSIFEASERSSRGNKGSDDLLKDGQEPREEEIKIKRKRGRKPKDKSAINMTNGGNTELYMSDDTKSLSSSYKKKEIVEPVANQIVPGNVTPLNIKVKWIQCDKCDAWRILGTYYTVNRADARKLEGVFNSSDQIRYEKGIEECNDNNDEVTFVLSSSTSIQEPRTDNDDDDDGTPNNNNNGDAQQPKRKGLLRRIGWKPKKWKCSFIYGKHCHTPDDDEIIYTQQLREKEGSNGLYNKLVGAIGGVMLPAAYQIGADVNNMDISSMPDTKNISRLLKRHQGVSQQDKFGGVLKMEEESIIKEEPEIKEELDEPKRVLSFFGKKKKEIPQQNGHIENNNNDDDDGLLICNTVTATTAAPQPLPVTAVVKIPTEKKNIPRAPRGNNINLNNDYDDYNDSSSSASDDSCYSSASSTDKRKRKKSRKDELRGSKKRTTRSDKKEKKDKKSKDKKKKRKYEKKVKPKLKKGSSKQQRYNYSSTSSSSSSSDSSSGSSSDSDECNFMNKLTKEANSHTKHRSNNNNNNNNNNIKPQKPTKYSLKDDIKKKRMGLSGTITNNTNSHNSTSTAKQVTHIDPEKQRLYRQISDILTKLEDSSHQWRYRVPHYYIHNTIPDCSRFCDRCPIYNNNNNSAVSSYAGIQQSQSSALSLGTNASPQSLSYLSKLAPEVRDKKEALRVLNEQRILLARLQDCRNALGIGSMKPIVPML